MRYILILLHVILFTIYSMVLFIFTMLGIDLPSYKDLVSDVLDVIVGKSNDVI